MSIKKTFRNSVVSSSFPVPLRVLTVAECADLLKISPSSIYELTRFRHSRSTTPLPHRKIGRYLRFIESEVTAWLLNQPQAVNNRKRVYRKAA